MKVKRENGMNMKKREEVEEQIKREEGAAGSDEGLSSVRRSSLFFRRSQNIPIGKEAT